MVHFELLGARFQLPLQGVTLDGHFRYFVRVQKRLEFTVGDLIEGFGGRGTLIGEHYQHQQQPE